jgi:ribosome-associated translation inhibitor RaiA
MHLAVHIPGAERIESLRSYIERRLHSGVGPHAGRVRGVSVRLSELSGVERGIVLTACRVEAQVGLLPSTIVVEALESNPYRAVDTAVERLSVALAQEVRPRQRARRERSGRVLSIERSLSAAASVRAARRMSKAAPQGPSPARESSLSVAGVAPRFERARAGVTGLQPSDGAKGGRVVDRTLSWPPSASGWLRGT